MQGLDASCIILALGNVAHLAALKAIGLIVKDYKFGHATRYARPNGLILYDSYHCSRYNTQTRRLTEAIFHEVFALVQQELVKQILV